MRLVAGLVFSISTLVLSLPASATVSGVHLSKTAPHVLGCYPWSGCRK